MPLRRRLAPRPRGRHAPNAHAAISNASARPWFFLCLRVSGYGRVKGEGGFLRGRRYRRVREGGVVYSNPKGVGCCEVEAMGEQGKSVGNSERG